MPHRAPFLCPNWGAVCSPMNYSIYLLCRSEVCLEKPHRTPKRPRVHSLVCANSDVSPNESFFLAGFSLLADGASASVSMHSGYGDCVWSWPPPFLSSFYMASLWDMWCACYPDRPCLTALIFGQLESVYMSVMPHPNSAKKNELS